jgi:hypothetical protein
MMADFVALPFGDIWCVVFAPSEEVKGLCGICTSKSVADEVVQRMASLANPKANISFGNPAYIPVAIFETSENGQRVMLDWFAGQILSTSAPQHVPLSKAPGMLVASNLQQALPSVKPYPTSLASLQGLLDDVLLSAKGTYGNARVNGVA